MHRAMKRKVPPTAVVTALATATVELPEGMTAQGTHINVFVCVWWWVKATN